MYPQPIQQLIECFRKLPTVGQRTASRFAFHLLKADPAELQELAEAIRQLKDRVALCSFCFNPFEQEAGQDLCPVCRDTGRERATLCVVEKESDLEALEATRQYQGLYFVLGGAVGLLKQEELRGLRMAELKERVREPKKFGLSPFQEVIVATNPTAEGEATALYIERLLATFNVRLTRLGRGLPIGAELEYADEETLKNALEGRR